MTESSTEESETEKVLEITVPEKIKPPNWKILHERGHCT